jgi:hypothetical protein
MPLLVYAGFHTLWGCLRWHITHHDFDHLYFDAGSEPPYNRVLSSLQKSSLLMVAQGVIEDGEDRNYFFVGLKCDFDM